MAHVITDGRYASGEIPASGRLRTTVRRGERRANPPTGRRGEPVTNLRNWRRVGVSKAQMISTSEVNAAELRVKPPTEIEPSVRIPTPGRCRLF